MWGGVLQVCDLRVRNGETIDKAFRGTTYLHITMCSLAGTAPLAVQGGLQHVQRAVHGEAAPLPSGGLHQALLLYTVHASHPRKGPADTISW